MSSCSVVVGPLDRLLLRVLECPSVVRAVTIRLFLLSFLSSIGDRDISSGFPVYIAMLSVWCNHLQGYDPITVCKT